MPGVEDAVALGLTRDEYALVVDKLGGASPTRSSWRCSRCCGASTAPTSTPRSCCARCRPRGPRSSWARARTPAPSTSAAAGRSRSRSSRTTTRARSSRSRARPPASAGSCATSSRSARGRSRCSTRCASASRTPSARATCSTARSPASATTATRSACRRSAARSTSRRPYETNCLVNAMALGLARTDDMIRSAAAGVGNVARAVRRLDRPRRHRRRVGAGLAPSSARTTRTSARRSRSATRSRRRSCWSARWSCSTAGCWSRCRTSARPG